MASLANKGLFEFVVQVGPDGNDQIAVAEGEGDLNSILDLSNTTVRVQVEGELSDGSEFTIFRADELAGLDSLTLLFDDPDNWDLSALSEGKIRTIVSPSVCDPATGGDINGDGVVSFPDFLILSANFGSSVADHTAGDIDCNGTVAFPDFLVLSANFGTVVGAEAASVPEPSGLALLGLAGLVGSVLRRRR